MLENNVADMSGKHYFVEKNKAGKCKDYSFFRSCWKMEEYNRLMRQCVQLYEVAGKITTHYFSLLWFAEVKILVMFSPERYNNNIGIQYLWLTLVIIILENSRE